MVRQIMYPRKTSQNTFSLTGKSPVISAVLVSWNTKVMTIACIDSLLNTLHAERISHEVILVDNASVDGTVEAVLSVHPKVKIIQNSENLGFSRAANRGLFSSCGEIVLLLNTDILLHEGGLSRMLSILKRNPSCGLAGPALSSDEKGVHIELSYFTRYPNGWDFIWDILFGHRLKNWRNRIPDIKYLNGSGSSNEHVIPGEKNPWAVAAVTGAFLCIKRGVIEKVGYLDEDFYFYFEDVDFCERASRAGWKILYCPEVSAIHRHNGSIIQRDDKAELFFKSFYRYLRKNRRLFPIYIIKILRRFFA